MLAVAAFAAGAVVTLLAKKLLDGRRTAGEAGAAVDGAGDGSKDDLATVLRRAALDVAVLASGQAADRLRSQDDEAETKPANSAPQSA
jgi:hypothetical protein